MSSRRIFHVTIVLVAAVVAGCGLVFGPEPRPPVPQFDPPAGTYAEQQWIRITSDKGQVFYTSDPDADESVFQRAWDMVHVEHDTELRAFTIDDRGIRSVMAVADYVIGESSPPVVVSSGIYQQDTTYRSFNITWDVSEPDEKNNSNPYDDVTDWYNLEFSVFASPDDNIDTIDDAITNGALVKDWHSAQTGGVGFASYQTSQAGETVYINVFVRDMSGNTTPYGTVKMKTPPALDIYVGNAAGADQIWLNNADLFVDFYPVSPADVVPTLTTTYAVALGDIDGDGYDDLVASYLDVDVYLAWFKARGNGIFDGTDRVVLRKEIPPAYVSEDIELADMDLDGDLEIVVAYRNGQGVDVFNSDGTLLFNVPSNQTNRVSVGDFDDDGYPDLVTSHYVPGVYSLWKNDSGTGITEQIQSWLPADTVSNPIDVLLTDLDDDSLADLVVSAPGEFRVAIYYSNGDGTFDPGPPQPPAWSSDEASRLAAIDWNDDGNTDLIFGNNTSTSFQETKIYLSDGAGGFPSSIEAVSGGLDCNGLSVADMDGDGDDDFVELLTTFGYRVWINDGGAIVVGPSQATPVGALAVGRLR